MQTTGTFSRELATREAAGDYMSVIAAYGNGCRPTRAFKDPWIKGWVGRRWRDLVSAAVVQNLQDGIEYALSPHYEGAAAVVVPEEFDPQGDRRALPQGRPRQRVAGADAGRPVRLDRQHHHPVWRTAHRAQALRRVDAHSFPVEAEKLYRERGWRTLRADVHPMRSCEANEADIEAAFRGWRASTPR